MYQNYVVEIKKTQSGDFEHNVFWLYDEDEAKAMLKAEAKYHAILAEAALSTMAEHAAILFTSAGVHCRNEVYRHSEEEAKTGSGESE